MRYVIYDPNTGTIRAVVTGSRDIAEQSVREGEAILEHAGFVAVRRHRVEGGAVVPL
jgi:hypothetical protein